MFRAITKRTGNSAEVRRQRFRHAIDEILLLRVAADIGEGQHHDGKPRRRFFFLFRLRPFSPPLRKSAGPCLVEVAVSARWTSAFAGRGTEIWRYCVNPDRPGDVLQSRSPKSVNCAGSRSRTCRYASSDSTIPPGSANAFEPRRDVDPVAHHVAVGLAHHVAAVDADAEQDLPLGRQGRDCARPCPAALQGRSAPRRRRCGTRRWCRRRRAFTTRPRCAAMAGSIRSPRSARSRASVRSSSAPARREYPTTSAANTAASLRSLFSAISRCLSQSTIARKCLRRETAEDMIHNGRGRAVFRLAAKARRSELWPSRSVFPTCRCIKAGARRCGSKASCATSKWCRARCRRI